MQRQMNQRDTGIVEHDGERYIKIRGTWYNASTYIKPPEIVSRRLDERFGNALPPEKPARLKHRPPLSL